MTKSMVIRSPGPATARKRRASAKVWTAFYRPSYCTPAVARKGCAQSRGSQSIGQNTRGPDRRRSMTGCEGARAMPEARLALPGIDVLVSEVGPRDGLQSVARTMPTEAKHRWIAALAAAGLAGDRGRLLRLAKTPAADGGCGEVVREAVDNPRPHRAGARAQPEGRGACLRGRRAQGHHAGFGVARRTAWRTSAAPPRRRSRRSRKACALRDGLPAARRPAVEVGISTAFGCTIEGPVAEDRVMRIAVALRGGRRRFRRPLRHDRLCQPGAGEAHVHAPQERDRRQSGRGAFPQYARPGPRQRRGGAGCRRDHLRCLARRPRRLPLRARRHRQHRHRGSRLPARSRWAFAPASTSTSSSPRAPSSPKPCRASRSTATSRRPGCRRGSRYAGRPA